MTWLIDDVPIFLAVVDHHGVTAAADYLNISKSKVSKSLSRLEDALGTRLIERNSRNIRITSEGETFFRHGQLIMEQVVDTRAVMSGLTSNPSGKLVVAFPMAFARDILARHLPDFHQQYPDIQLELIVSSHPVDTIREQVDISVVVGALDNSELIAKPLYHGNLICVTSPAYAQAHRLGNTEKDLISHIQICEKRYAINQFSLKVKKRKCFVDLSQTAMQTNDPLVVREALIQGFGVSIVPEQYCKTQIYSGELIRIYQNITFDTTASIISAVYPSSRLMSSKTRAFLDFLQHICMDNES